MDSFYSDYFMRIPSS